MLAAIPSRTPKTIRPTLLITRIPYSLSNILAVDHATPTKVVCRAPAVRWLMDPVRRGWVRDLIRLIPAGWWVLVGIKRRQPICPPSRRNVSARRKRQHARRE